jgi:uroporphyrinogen decarboxylase
MNDRERFLATMAGQPRDRAPLYDFSTWDETVPAWHAQGLPDHVHRQNLPDYFGLDTGLQGGDRPGWQLDIHWGLWPAFEQQVVDDDGDQYTELQNDGVWVRKQRSSVSIPMHVGHTLVDAASWRQQYKPRLDPDHPDRRATDFASQPAADPNRDHPVFAGAGSLFGRLRDWMGLENIVLVVYDDPAWFEEMVTTLADLSVALLTRAFEQGARPDAVHFWEDMAYNAGPLLSPTHFKQYLVPQYRRVADLCQRYGCDTLWVDCDGKIDDLIPLWLDAGVNTMFPLEIGTWGADPVRYRREYGMDLRMMGGFDKRILATTPEAIAQEIARLAPLVEEGRYIPFCDHRVPPDVPLANYRFYCREARRVWGGGVHLRPAEMEQTAAATT